MSCSDCEESPCVCDDPDVRRGILMTILDLMQEKVIKYRNLMQNRVFMIREDIISTIAEETSKFQKLIDTSIGHLDNLMHELQDNDEGTVEISPELVEAMNFKLEFNLNSVKIQNGFQMALAGGFVVFREMLREKSCENKIEEIESEEKQSEWEE
jgi:hypothetical protein